MSAQIRPNRLDVTDRFPMLGFTIRSSNAARGEVALATDPSLFAAENRSKRTPSNFHSSRAQGDLVLPRGEAVWIVPADVLGRFVGSQRIYFALAVAENGQGSFQVAFRPTADSPYVSIAGLSGRSLRRVRLLPARIREGGDGGMSWAGDQATPGQQPLQQPAAPARNGASGTPQPASPGYDDGFGPLPEAPSPAPAPVADIQPTPAAQAFARAQSARRRPMTLSLSSEATPIAPAGSSAISGLAKAAAETVLMALPGPLAPLLTALRAAAQLSGAAGAPVSIGFGPAVGGGLFSGGSLGAGIIFGPNGELGVYGAGQLNVGFILSISLTAQITVVRGGIESFNGISNAVVVSGGEGIVGGGAALFDQNMNFQGISVEAGIGAGFSPIDFYVAVQKQVATELGLAAAMGMLPRSLSADGILELKYRAFIPAPAVAGPLETFGGDAFGGDGRSFAYSGGSSRGELTAKVHLTPGGGISHIEIVDAHWEPSTAYDPSHTVAAAGKPDWWRDKLEGAHPTRTETLVRTPSNLDIATGGGGSTARNVEAIASQASIVTITAAGPNPLVSLAPAIDADLSVMIRQGASGVEVMVVGSHDGFPAHELYANGLLVHSYDPVAAGASPTSLFPGGGVDVRTGWMSVGGAAVSQGLGRARTARAFDAAIPLDPGVGGMSIGYDALQPGDIILSTTDATVSKLIRFGTAGQVSHAMLYVGQGGQVIEAIGEGVLLRPLDQALADATVAVAFRVPALDPTARLLIADAAAGMLDLPYNYIGIARQAAFQVDRQLCNVLPNGLSDKCRAFVGKVDLGTADNSSFFCSQLILEAYSRAGHAITTEPPHWASPQDLAELRLDYARMAYVGHLKAVPSGGLFGHILAHSAGVGRSRTARALSGDAWSVNWDDVELIGQREDLSCWAASLSMLIGWRDRQSVDEASVASACGRAPNQRGPIQRADVLAVTEALGLGHSEPATYSAEGFRTLLENHGPIWVCKQFADGVESGHAVLAVGLYSDGTETYVRVVDPWDREVGTPGAPGPHMSTHTTGSRYIQRYADFVAEYQWQQRLMNDLPADVQFDMLQMIHAHDTGGRVAATSSPPAGFAQGLGRRTSRALDVVEPDYAPGGPLDAIRNLWDYGTRFVSWHAGVPNAKFMPHSAICQIEVTQADGSTGQGTGFYAGPGLIVTAAHVLNGATNARVYRGRTDGDFIHMFDTAPDTWTLHPYFAAIADAYDIAVIRAQVFPVAQGDYFEMADLGDSVFRKVFVSGYAADTSRGLNRNRQHMDGTSVHEMSVDGQHIVYNLQTTGGTSGSPVVCLVDGGDPDSWSGSARVIGVHADAHTPNRNIGVRLTQEKISWILNRGMVAPLSLGMGSRGMGSRRAPPPPPSRGPARGLDAGLIANTRRVESELNGVTFALEQLDGMRSPRTQAAVQMTPMPAELLVEDWPRMPDEAGPVRGGVKIGWKHAVGAVGEVTVAPTVAGLAEGWSLAVRGTVQDGPDSETTAAVSVELLYCFNRKGEPEQRATVKLVLRGDGSHVRTNEWAPEPAMAG